MSDNSIGISEKAQLILDALNEVYTDEGIALPARQYLAVGGRGETVHDCEQVTVSWEMGYSGIPGAQSQTPVLPEVPRSAVFVVEVVRRLPSSNGGRAISVDALNAIANMQMADGVLMMDAGMLALSRTFYQKGIVDVAVGSPQGEYQAVILSVIAVI